MSDYPKIWGTGDQLPVALGKLRNLQQVPVPYLSAVGPGFRVGTHSMFPSVELYSPGGEPVPVQWICRTSGTFPSDTPSDVEHTEMFFGRHAEFVQPVEGVTLYPETSDWSYKAAPGHYIGRGEFAAPSARVNYGLGATSVAFRASADIADFCTQIYAPVEPMTVSLGQVVPGKTSPSTATAVIENYAAVIDYESYQFNLPTFIGFTKDDERVFLLAGSSIEGVEWALDGGRQVASFPDLSRKVVPPKVWRVVIDAEGEVTQSTQVLQSAVNITDVHSVYTYTHLSADQSIHEDSQEVQDTLFHITGAVSVIGPGRAIIPVATFLNRGNFWPTNHANVQEVLSMEPDLRGETSYVCGYYLTEDYGQTFAFIKDAGMRTLALAEKEAAIVWNPYVAQPGNILPADAGLELATAAAVFASRTRAVAVTPTEIRLFSVGLNMEYTKGSVPAGNIKPRTATIQFFTSSDGAASFNPCEQTWKCNGRSVPEYGGLQPIVPSANGFLLPSASNFVVLDDETIIAEVYDARDFSAYQANYNVIYFRSRDGGVTWAQLPMTGLAPAPLGSMSSLTGPITVVERGEPPLLALMGALDSLPSQAGTLQPRTFKTIGLFLSSDAGDTWEQSCDIEFASNPLRNVFVQPAFYCADEDLYSAYTPSSQYPDQLYDYRALAPFSSGSMTKICDSAGWPEPAFLNRPWLYDPDFSYEPSNK